jgi:RND family efflux transporter MFP subunit
MKNGIKKIIFGNDTENYLAKTILLEEAISPFYLKGTILFVAFLVFLSIIWASFARLDVVAKAIGKIVPSDSVQVIQHQDGGRISKIFVDEGSHVKKGDMLILLDDTAAKSDLESLKARSEKLKSEVNYLAELAKIRSTLAKQNLVPKTSSLDAEKTLAQTEGDYESTVFEINKLEDRLSRTEIRSPSDGIVQDLKYRTIGGVIPPGATVMNVVPSNDTLRAELHVSTNDIGHINVGQNVRLKLDTYDFMRYGVINGKITVVSAYSSIDDKTNLPYFLCYATVPKKYLGDVNRPLPVQPGMTLQADIVTYNQTVLEYVLRPLYIAFKEGMKER